MPRILWLSPLRPICQHFLGMAERSCSFMETAIPGSRRWIRLTTTSLLRRQTAEQRRSQSGAECSWCRECVIAEEGPRSTNSTCLARW